MDILESRQVGKVFKPVNPKRKDQGSIRNNFLSLNLLVCWAEMCKQFVCLVLVQQKSYVINFCCDFPIDSKQKQVKASEVYLLWIFCKKTLSYW